MTEKEDFAALTDEQKAMYDPKPTYLHSDGVYTEPAAMHEEEKNKQGRYAEQRAQTTKEDVLVQMINRGDFKPSNPKDVIATTRLDINLFPQTAIVYGALGMMEGHLKYGGYNYRVGGVLTSVYLSAHDRHLIKFNNGEWADEKTGVPHLASAIACLSIIVDAYECGVLNDDRPPAVPNIGRLLDDMQEKVKHLLEVFPPEKSPGRFTEVEHGKDNNSSETLHNSASRGGTLPTGSGD